MTSREPRGVTADRLQRGARPWPAGQRDPGPGGGRDEQLGYKPHTGAASLRSGRTYRIACPIPDAELHPGNVIMLEFLQFLVAAARERKHQVLDATVADLLGPPDRPTAVIAGSDVLAAACYAGATRTGLRIGADLAVTGFDGSTVARILTPALTTVAMPLAEVAERLVNRIVGAVCGVSGERGEVLGTTLIWGESV